MSSLLRISNECLLEFGDLYTKKITEDELYAYKFSNNIQILNQDGSINDRDKSFCPYYQNVLLKRTPYPFFSEEFHQAAAMSKLVSASMPALEYQKVTVNFSAGFFYSNEYFGSMIRFYYIVDGIMNFTVGALVDERTASRLKANTRNIVLDNQVFNASFDAEFLNLGQLLNSDDPDIQKIVQHLFGLGNHTCSELFIEFALISNANVMSFYSNNHPHQRFFTDSLSKQYWTKQDTDANLFCSFRKDDENMCLRMNLLHTKYNVQQYLEKMLTDQDTWTIEYELTTTAYNFEGNVISSISVQLANFANYFTEVIYRPIVLREWMQPSSGLESDKVDHLMFEVRCIARTSLSQLEITRYAKLVETNPQKYYFGLSEISITAPKVYSRKEVVSHEVKMNTDLPNIVKIIKPYYVQSITGGVITLTPYDTNVQIDLTSVNLTSAGKLTMRIDTRSYEQKELSNKKAIFTIPASEYLQKTKNWYIFDSNNQMITYGTIERVETEG